MPDNYLIPRVGIKSGSSWLWLPPYNLTVGISEDLYQDVRFIPHAPAGSPAHVVAASYRKGWFLDLEFFYRLDTIYAGWQWQQALRAALVSATTNQHILVDFSRFVDTSGVLKGVFRRCIAAGGPEFGAEVPGSERARACRLRLWSLDGGIYTTDSASQTPGISDWENVFLSEVVGGEAEGDAVVPVKQTYIIPVSVPGIAEVTAAGNADRWQIAVPIAGTTTSQMLIKALRLVATGGAQGGPDASTTAVISDKEYDAADQTTISDSLAQAESASAGTTGSVPITLNAAGMGTAYLYFTQSAAHQNLIAYLQVESP